MSETGRKKICLIKEWYVAECEAHGAYILTGFVFEENMAGAPEQVVTSHILTIDFVNKIAETEDAFYKLG